MSNLSWSEVLGLLVSEEQRIEVGEPEALPPVPEVSVPWPARDDLAFVSRPSSDPGRGVMPMAVAQPKIPISKCRRCDGVGSTFARQGHYEVAVDCVCQNMTRAAGNYNRARIPPNYAEARFENTNWDHPGAAAALPHIQRLVNEWRPRMPGWVAAGRNGTGKTRAAAMACAALALRGPLDYGDRAEDDVQARLINVRCVEWTGLLTAIRDGFDRGVSESQWIGPLAACDVLWIDELGKGKRTDWTDALVETLVSQRLEQERTTIITSNLPLSADHAPPTWRRETLRDVLGDRAFSRLCENTPYIEMDGPDYRQHMTRRRFPAPQHG